MKGTAPLPVDPCGGVGQGCAGKMCGRDACVPGWAIFHTTNREHDLRHAREWGKGLFARRKETHGAVAGQSKWRTFPTPRRENVRAGRPRSRVGINHTRMRGHDLHHAQESGKAPFASLKYHFPLEGESQKPSRIAKPDAVGGRRGVARWQSPQSTRSRASATSRGSQPFPVKNPAY